MNNAIRAFGQRLAHRPRVRPSGDTGPKATVLVIDDDTTLLDVLRPVVRSAGYNVFATTSSAKGLDVLRFDRHNIRVVVLDYNLPVLNGAAALEYVRKLKPGVKVIGLTGFTGADLPASFGRGVDHLLTKPCTNSHLVACIQGLLGDELAQTLGLA